MVSVLDFRSEVGDSSPSPCHRVVSFKKKLYPTRCTCINGYWRHNAGGDPVMD